MQVVHRSQVHLPQLQGEQPEQRVEAALEDHRQTTAQTTGLGRSASGGLPLWRPFLLLLLLGCFREGQKELLVEEIFQRAEHCRPLGQQRLQGDEADHAEEEQGDEQLKRQGEDKTVATSLLLLLMLLRLDQLVEKGVPGQLRSVLVLGL